MTITVIILGIVAAGLLFLFVKRTQEARTSKQELGEITEKYKDISEHDTTLGTENDELKNISQTTKLKLDNVIEKYKDIIDIDKTLTTKNDEVKSINQNLENLKANFDKQKDQLNQDYVSKRNIYENLLREISILEENLENISYGLYKPHYDYNSSDEYKQKLDEIWNKEKELIKTEGATSFSRDWTVNGSKAEGLKMVKHQSKL